MAQARAGRGHGRRRAPLTPERWSEIVAIFERAAACSEADRPAVLDGLDAETRGEVESLLRHASDSDDEPAVASAVASAAAALVGVSADRAGTSLGHFQIEELCGRGGMGVVYRAIDKRLGRTVALKLLPDGVTAEGKRRFLREAKVAATVNHPNIATIYEVGEVDGHMFIAMELVTGTSMRERLTGAALAVSEALAIARQILAALGAAHDAGITHRDLKPENVMLDAKGVVKVLDFGLAKHDGSAQPTIEADTLTQHRAGQLRGTPSYMSPEQARGEALDCRSDIFSFGVMLYEMVTGARPFAGATVMDVVSSILRDEPQPAFVRNADISRALSDAIARCLAKAPALRYADCASLVAALDGLDEQSTRPPARRHRRVIAGVAITVLACSAGAYALWFRSSSSRSHGVAITDTPPPESSSREALASYATALQSFRDSNWGAATEDLRRAVAIDPQLAAAYLRLALTGFEMYAPASEIGANYGHAVRTRNRLDARNRALLDALEPVFNRAPPNRALASERLQAVADQFPADAEVHWILGVVAARHDPDLTLRAARRAAELDPAFADAWYPIAEVLEARGSDTEALDALERCVAITPSAADCHGAKARIQGKEGRCEEMERTLQLVFATNPSSEWAEWVELRGRVFHALGRPQETVIEALRPRWTLGSPANREWRKYLDQARVAAAWGDFERAEQLAADGVAHIASDQNAITHARFVELRIELAGETGHLDAAGRLADDFLKRSDVWLEADARSDPTVPLLRTLLDANLISRETFETRRRDWVNRAGGRYVGTLAAYLWLLADVQGVTTGDDATRAMTGLSRSTGISGKDIWDRAEVGRVALLAGRVDDALPRLEALAQSCNELESPVTFMRDLVAYAGALETKGRRAEACATYAHVLSRWGTTGAVTARRARERSDALACDRRP